MLKELKRAALGLMKGAGVFALVRDSAWRRHRLLILCYHGTALRDEHEWSPTLYVSQEHLRARFRMLRDGGYQVLPLGEGVRRLRDGTLPPRAVAVTFDDGTYDFFARARPVIEEFRLPVTLYLTTFYSGFQRPVFDPVVQYILWRGRDRTADLSGVVPGTGTVALADPVARRAVIERLFVFGREAGLSAEAKDDIARRLASRVGVDYDALCADRLLHIMTPDEVRALPRDLIDVELHTHRHRTPRDHDLFFREIEDNRREIDRILPGAPATQHFCYPSGFHRPEFLPWLRDLGVRTATTCETGLAAARAEPLALPRFIDTMHVSPVEFEGWLTGVSAWLPRRDEPLSLAHQVAMRDDYRRTGALAATPTIGVIMPCRNGARFIREALESVRAQTLPPTRVIVIDDGSTDDSAAIARSLGAEVITNTGEPGPGAARNRGIAALDTELIAFLDADDIWRPDHLASLVPLLDHGVAVVFSDADRTDGSVPPQRHNLPADVPLDLLPTLLRESPLPQSGSLVRLEVVREAGGYDESFRLAEDYELWLRIAARHRMAYSGRRTCTGRVHEGQASRNRAMMIRGGWAARRKLWHAIGAGALPARQIERQAAGVAMTAAWEGSLSAALYLRDRALARELLTSRDELGVPGSTWWTWWLRVEVLWQPRRVVSALWRLVQPST